MINIPTELLRTLVAVVDLRSFTKAAQSLGVTQPAVSAQIKRLQILLDRELFDKSAPGVSLTPSGEIVMNYARRMLSINDQIVDLAVPGSGSRILRIGVPGDFAAVLLPSVLSRFRSRYRDVGFTVRSDHFDVMSRELRDGGLDLMIGLSENRIAMDTRHHWTLPLAWIRQPGFEIDPAAPVPLVTFGEACSLHRAVALAFSRQYRAFEVVFSGPSRASLLSAVKAGLGVSMLARDHALPDGIEIWHDAPLPMPADLFCGIYLGERGEQPVLEALADTIYDIIGPNKSAASIVPTAATSVPVAQY